MRLVHRILIVAVLGVLAASMVQSAEKIPRKLKDLAGENLSGPTDNQVVAWDNGTGKAVWRTKAGDVTGPSSGTARYLAEIDNTGKVIARSPCYFDMDNVLWCPAGYGTTQSAVNPGDLKLYELSGNGTNYVGLKAPDNVTTTYQYVLPPDKCTAGQSLRFLTDNVTLECFSPAVGGTLSWNMLYNSPDAADNTSPWRSSVAVTITEIGGYFIDNTGAISTSASDNAAVTLSFCAPDNVVSCTDIDTTTIVGGTSIYSDQSMGGTAVVPAKSPVILKFGTINTTKPFMVNVFYTVN